MSQQPLRVFTDRRRGFDEWMLPLIKHASHPITVMSLCAVEGPASAFMVPYYSDFGGLSLFISQDIVMEHDVSDFLDQAKQDKFRAVYLLNGNQGVMLFRNKYCEKLTPDYVLSAPIEELRTLAWAGAKENVGLLTFKVEV